MQKQLKHGLIASALVLLWVAATLYAPASGMKVALSSVFLLVFPGFLLFCLIQRGDRSENFWPGLAYSVGFSCLYLMLLGLAASVISPFIGVSEPLNSLPLVGAISTSLFVLIATVLKKHGEIMPPKASLPRGTRAWLTVGFGALLPVTAAAGATILNNGGSGKVALTAMGLIPAFILWLIWLRRQRLTKLYPYALYTASLAILLSNSLRGWFITGHDIIQEYQVFQLTSLHGIWSMKFLQDAYNACLSITILPTILAKLTGISDPYIYKLIFQMIFALVPVVLYLTLSRFLPRRAALLSAFVFMSFPTFLLDMPMLCRQELAFLYFGLILMTLFEASLHRRTRSILVLLLGLGMILSHYSTSYVAIGVILIAKSLELVVLGWDRWRKNKLSESIVAMPLSWPITIALVLTVYLWNSQITNTSQSIANTIVGTTTSLPRIFGGLTQSGIGSYSLVGHSQSSEERFAQYAAQTTAGRDLPANEYYPASITNNYPVQPAEEQVSPPTRIGQVLSKLHIPLYTAYDLARSSYAKLIQVLVLVGLIALAFRKQFSRIPRQYLLLGMGSLVMIVLEVILPSVINYGILRMLQQALMLLAPAIVLALYVGFGLLRFSKIWRVRATALLLIGFYLVNSGFITTVTGGYKPTLAASNSGLYYEAYYTHATDIAGNQWLASSTPKGSIVNADEFARRRMITYSSGRIYARGTLAPDAISTGAYVLLSYGDSDANSVPFYYNGSLNYEQPPTQFLNDNKNLLYSSGQVRIYR